jgi:MFS family permease
VASFASGALVGSLGLSAFGARIRPARTMMAACVAWYFCLLCFALPISQALAMALLVGAGLSQSLAMVSLSILLLRTSEPRFRGRVMGVRMLAIYTLPLGLLAAGALITTVGFHTMALMFVALGLLLTVTVALAWRHELLSRDAVANAR